MPPREVIRATLTGLIATGALAAMVWKRPLREAYASKMHVDDLIEVEKQLGYRYELPDAEGAAEHYQRICPRCRRAGFALAQGRRWSAAHHRETRS